MVESDKQRFAQIMVTLGVAFDNAPTREKMALYFDDLKRFSVDDLEWSAKEARMRLKFFPKVSELIDFAMIAPRPKANCVGFDRGQELLEALEPAAVVEKRLEKIAAVLNGKYGTNFRVELQGERPVLLGSGERG